MLVLANKHDWDDFLGLIFAVIGCIIFALSLIFIPIYRNDVYVSIQKHEVIRQTVIAARDQGDITQFERISLTEDVIDANKRLTHMQYYAGHPWFKLYYPEEVLDVELIR